MRRGTDGDSSLQRACCSEETLRHHLWRPEIPGCCSASRLRAADALPQCRRLRMEPVAGLHVRGVRAKTQVPLGATPSHGPGLLLLPLSSRSDRTVTSCQEAPGPLFKEKVGTGPPVPSGQDELVRGWGTVQQTVTTFLSFRTWLLLVRCLLGCCEPLAVFQNSHNYFGKSPLTSLGVFVCLFF